MSASLPRFVLALVIGAAAGLCSARDDSDGVKKKLDDAKKTYTAEAEKFKEAVTDHLDKREAEARNCALTDRTRTHLAMLGIRTGRESYGARSLSGAGHA